MIPVMIDEDLDYIEANDYIAAEWQKRCPFQDCEACPIAIKCQELWDKWANRVEDKKLKKSEISRYIKKKFTNIQIEIQI